VQGCRVRVPKTENFGDLGTFITGLGYTPCTIYTKFWGFTHYTVLHLTFEFRHFPFRVAKLKVFVCRGCMHCPKIFNAPSSETIDPIHIEKSFRGKIMVLTWCDVVYHHAKFGGGRIGREKSSTFFVCVSVFVCTSRFLKGEVSENGIALSPWRRRK